MSSTKTNSTNITVPAAASSSASTALPQTTAGSNTTGQSSTATAGTSSASNNMTLLTFGPLSSCIDLPNLSAGSVPRTANMADAARKQAIQTWLASLPTTSSCSALSWTLRPDYSPHLQAMSTFQAQLEQLFPAVANTSSTGGVNGIANASSASSNTSFFPSTPATSAFSASTSSTSTLPTTLPLWIGITLASTALVHLLALILHICSDLDALFPSLVAKLHSRPEEFELPQHVQQPNESTTTLVESPGDADAKADPPQYTEPPADVGKAGVEGGMVETPGLIRMARKCKRLVVPLLLVSALAMVGVAVVLNAKFVVGAVGGFGGSSVAASLPVASSAGSNATVTGANVTSAAVTSMSADSSRSHPATSATSSMADVAATSTATPVALSTSDRVEKVTASSTAPAVLATSSMTKLVRRQVNFFPTASSSTPSSSLAASLAPTTSTATPSPTEPNASLFPTLTTTTNPPSSTTAAAATLTASSSASATATSTTTSTSAFVLQRSSSIHRLWWIVMLDLVLWFAQRRRTRSQTALDKARAFVVGQLADAGKRALK
ncbi:conserved hypothetical protein [Sporisorium reilianum SRZ2]|uniref:Uncharacterized protein n=1 Tax=Sporisorium reilianum (strain SRZ2) TaxID=999809 RepID=E6ZPP7_SPORE|nr:conserved hypothetical protein [Sporisorium reilianum SRZ2]